MVLSVRIKTAATARLGLSAHVCEVQLILRAFAELMNVHWARKKERSPNMTRTQIDEWYELARKNGAMGGKLIGAGGGGFFLFYSEDQARLREAMRKAGLSEVRFKFDFEGTKVII